MATPLNKKIADFAYKHFAHDMGSFLLVTGIIGWVASCFNQTVAIVVNKKIPNKDKKFLIPQEVADGLVNTILFALFTRSFTKFGEKLVHSGRMATKELANYYKTTKIDGKTIDSLIGTKVDVLKKNGKIVKKDFNIAEAMAKIDPKEESDFSKKYWPFATGVSFAFSTIGAVFSCDLVTPLVRNKIASIRQKSSLQKEQLEQQALLQRTTFQQPLKQPEMQKQTLNTYPSKVSQSGAGMKI